MQNVKIRRVKYLTQVNADKIKIYLQGAVYSWCNDNKGREFALRDLVGGLNLYWSGTPLDVLYHNRLNINLAGRDAGWLLMEVLQNDKRNFDTYVKRVRHYQWLGPYDYPAP